MVRSLRAGGIACLGAGLLFLAHAVPVAAQEASSGPIVTYPTSVQISSPLSSAPPASAAPTTGQRPLEIPLHALPQGQTVPGGEHASDHAVQTNAAQVLEAQPLTSFGGISQDGLIPPDPNIAVGLNQVVEVVNSEIAVYDKSGNLAPGFPKPLSWLWQTLPGACSQSNSGDPVVQYDKLADNGNGRWFIGQLASLSSPYAECIAVSQNSDATGSYFVYSYSFNSNLNDYPKFGVWPTSSNSAYLGTYNLFANGATFVGAALCAYDREAMLVGASAAQICNTVSTSAGGFLPSDLDGSTQPAAGEPGYFLAFNATTKNSLTLYKMTLDFANTTNSSLSGPTEISVGTFSPACGGGTCIPQPSTKKKLDSLGDRLMYRLAYRKFSDHESMVVNHSVTTPSGTVAPRWYQLDATTQGQFSVAQNGQQSGIYAPDSSYRWMGSIAMDQAGDILLGYSKSSSSSYPSIFIAGRLPTDTPGTLRQEISLLNGGGSQTMYSRWGDYTSMRIDPADDCTFWYVNEYLPQTSFGNWSTHIDSYKFTGCSGGGGSGSPDFSLSVSPASLNVPASSNSPATVSLVPLNSFANTVGLTATCSQPISCSFNPTSIDAAQTLSSTLTVAVAFGADAGTITETVTGTDATTKISHNTSFTLTVPASDFSISAGTLLPISRNSSGSTAISLTDLGASNSSITLSVIGLPRQTSASFSPGSVKVNAGSPPTPVSSTLKINVGRNAPRGTYPLTVTGTDGNYTRTTSVSLTIQ